MIASFVRPRFAFLVLLLVNLSALALGDSVVVFNEVMYHPRNEADPTEWIELHNQMTADVDLSGWSLGGGVAYDFPEGTILRGGGYLVVASDPETFATETTYNPALGPFEGRLANDGEELELRNNNGRLMDRLAFGDSGDWPVAPDGSGASLAKRRPDLPGMPAANWRGSAETRGTPGRSNFSDLGPGWRVLVDRLADAWAWVPTHGGLEDAWKQPDFNHWNWQRGQNAVGYETKILWENNYAAYLGLDVQEEMLDRSRSCYVRIPFYVAEERVFTSLTLVMRYDAGFVAYLNGVEIARANAPASPAWNSGSTAAHYGIDALAPEVFDLSERLALLAPGRNVLAVHALSENIDNPDFMILPELHAFAPATAKPLVFNEIAAAGEEPFWVEILNPGESPVDLASCSIAVDGAATTQTVLSGPTLPAGGFLHLDLSSLGFDPVEGDRLFLYLPLGAGVADATVVAETLRGRYPDGSDAWLYPSKATPEEPNQVAVHDAIVINEIMYHARPYLGPRDAAASGTLELTREDEPSAYRESQEEWIELYNRGEAAVDLGGWRFDDAVDFEFPVGTTLEPDAYLVVASNATSLSARHPEARVLGDFARGLSDSGDRVLLLDAAGNPADEVHYYDGGRWPAYADGDGHSLELRDPRSDNSLAEAWAASDEGAKAEWHTYRYRGRTRWPFEGIPAMWQELDLGLLDGAGEVLLDDFSVVEDPDAAALELMANGSFESMNSAGWRFVGNHQRSGVIADPDNPGNSVLRLSASGPTEYMGNQIETTYSKGQRVVPDQIYEVSFRAKWLAGASQLSARLYFYHLARTTRLIVPESGGTPGARNSRYVENAGPTYRDFRHEPIVPSPNEETIVSVLVHDPDGVDSLDLFYRVGAGDWTSATMTDAGGGLYRATIPGQAKGAAVQFYASGRDLRGAVSTCPARGRDSRALFLVDPAPTERGSRGRIGPLRNLRVILTPEDTTHLHLTTNALSNERLGATVIYGDRDVFYDAGVRLKGSFVGRDVERVGFNLVLGSDQPLLGVHTKIALDRSAHGDIGLDEVLIKHIASHAGGIPSMYDDPVHLTAPRSAQDGPALMRLAGFDDVYLDSQFENGSKGSMYEYEVPRWASTTDNGSPSGLKIPGGGGYSNIDMQNIGASKEEYRWIYLLMNNRTRDDFTNLMETCRAFGIGDEATLAKEIPRFIDVDQWMRTFAYQTLLAPGDSYPWGNAHNLRLYVRPSDGRVLAMPWDWDSAFLGSVNGSLIGNWNLGRIIGLPANRRLFYGHLLDVIDTTYNKDYMARWTRHFGALARQDFTARLNFIDQRAAFARSAVASAAPAVPFEITTNGGDAFTTAAAFVNLEGTAWVDVRAIRLEGRPTPLEVEWTGFRTWRTTVPLVYGENRLVLEALSFQDEALSSDTIAIVSNLETWPLRDLLRIAEIMYHPPNATPSEIAAGYSDPDAFEYIELLNTSKHQTLDLGGVRFTAGVEFDFADGTLAPGERIVVVENLEAFRERYGARPRVAGRYSGRLDNAGEIVELRDAEDEIIQRFAYADDGAWPPEADGQGSSLEAIDASGDYSDPRNWRAASPSPAWDGETPIPLRGAPVFRLY